MRKTALSATVLILLVFSSSANGQNLPDKIRGYKVHKIKLAFNNQDQTTPKETDVLVKLGQPKISANGPLSMAIDVAAEFTAMRQSGKIDFVTFRDFRVNGIAVDVEEYTFGFTFKNNVRVSLSKPVRATIGVAGLAKAAYSELIESKKEWAVTGTVFVFGRFNKLGFRFKRVVPVKIDIKIKNPVPF